MKLIKVVVTTDAGGVAAALSPRVSGKIHSVQYVKDTANAGAAAFADTVDFTVTAEKTGESIWAQSNVTASATVYPRAPTHDRVGAPSLYAAAGAAVLDKVAIVDRVKIAIAQGGANKRGTFNIMID